MTRFLVAVTAAGVLAAAAPAQFLPRGRQQLYNFGYAPAGFGNGVGFNYGGFNFAYFQTRQFNYIGPSGPVSLNFSYYGAIPPGGYGGLVANPYAQAAYLYGGAGGYGGYNPGANPVIQQQQAMLAAGRPDNGRGNDANRLIADQAQMEFGRALPRAAAPAAVNLDPALLDPPDAAVMAGDTLNALHAAIRPLLEKRKGEPPLFPAEVLGHLRFDGPAAADVLALVRAGKLQFPPPLDGPAFEKLRADVEKPVAELVAAAADNRRSDVGAADRLAFAVKQGRTAHADDLRALGVTEALAASRFLSALDKLAEAGRDNGLTGFYPAKWATGATATELLTQMDRLKLTFGPAGPGDDDAYAAAHRGLVTFYMSLATPKK